MTMRGNEQAHQVTHCNIWARVRRHAWCQITGDSDWCAGFMMLHECQVIAESFWVNIGRLPLTDSRQMNRLKCFQDQQRFFKPSDTLNKGLISLHNSRQQCMNHEIFSTIESFYSVAFSPSSVPHLILACISFNCVLPLSTIFNLLTWSCCSCRYIDIERQVELSFRLNIFAPPSNVFNFSVVTVLRFLVRVACFYFELFVNIISRDPNVNEGRTLNWVMLRVSRKRK